MTTTYAPPTGGTSVGREVHRRPGPVPSYIHYDAVADPFFESVLVRFDQAFAGASEPAETANPPGIASRAAAAVDVVRELMERLGLSQKDVISAAGIRKRTFQDWVKNPSRQPRLSSQADLWALAQSVEAMADELGADLERWLKAEPERINLLCRGEHRELVRLARRGGSDDPSLRAAERLEGVGYFDEGEEAGVRVSRADTTPTRGAVAVRARRRGDAP